MREIYLTTLLLIILLMGCQIKKEQRTKEQTVRIKVIQVSKTSGMIGRNFSGIVEKENGTTLTWS